MSRTNFYFARHGESEANLLNVFSNRGSKHGLTSNGKQQVLTLAMVLKKQTLSRIYSSPLLRAVETAEILAEQLVVPWEISDTLREYDCGILEGKSDRDSWEQYIQVLTSWIEYGQWERRIKGGESFLEIQNRFIPFVDHLVKKYQYSGESLILVAHGGIFRIMLPLIFENIDYSFVMDHKIRNAGFVRAEVINGELKCLSWDGIKFT